MFEAGDRVRIIMPSYTHMSKAGFQSPGAWDTPDPNADNVVMLGGEYEVLEVLYKKSQYPLYRVLPDEPKKLGNVSDQETVAANKVELCPYDVGDKVRFNCRWAEEDYRAIESQLHLAYGFHEPDTIHEIRHILNDYYVFLDYEPGKSGSTPFAWMHLDKVDQEPAPE